MADLTPDNIATLLLAPSEAGYVALRDSIAQEGLRRAIVRWRGVTVDGRARERACRELGVAMAFDDFDDAHVDPQWWQVGRRAARGG